MARSGEKFLTMPLLDTPSDLLLVLSRLALLSGAYWLLAWFIEKEGLWRLATRLGLTHPGWARGVGFGGLLLLSGYFDWARMVPMETLGATGPAPGTSLLGWQVIRGLSFGLAALLAWKLSTSDVEVVTGERRLFARLMLVGGTLALWWNPAWLVVPSLFLTRPFQQWRHHAILPMRALLGVAAYGWLRQLEPLLPSVFWPYLPDPAMLFFFLFTLHASHYMSAGVAKLTLGPRWWSWVLDNPLHFLPANAYAWGWARFIPWSIWLKVIQLVKVFRVPALVMTLAVELLAPLVLLSREAALLGALLWCGFHSMVFLLSGLLFWEWILANALLAGGLWLLPLEQQQLFGWPAVLLSTAFIVWFPLKNRLWGPISLGWWETPLTQRMHWVVEGKSGQRYEVFNRFMCPHERLYGVVHALFMAPVPLLSYDMGSAWELRARLALERAALGQEPIEQVRNRFGVQPRHPEWEANHLAYLQQFFSALNRGAVKHILPKPLRWLKAPGGHIYSWGDLPAYHRQEPVVKVLLYFRELAFDGTALQLWRNELVRTIPIEQTTTASPEPPESAEALAHPREPASREVERFISGAFWRAAQGWKESSAPTSEAAPTTADKT